MSKKIDRFLVVHEFDCQSCEGQGFVSNPEWAEASKLWDQWVEQATAGGVEHHWTVSAAGEALDRFWKERGYHRKPPPEELPCVECQGEGIVRQQVDIMQALAAIVDDDERWEDWRDEQEMRRAAARGLA